MSDLILASASAVRAGLLRQAQVNIEVVVASIDEDAVKASMIAEGARARDIADALAEAKARKIAAKFPDRMVLGADQVLDLDGQLLSKPTIPEDAVDQLKAMRGKTHKLFSAAVIYDEAKPVWRHVGQVSLTMWDMSDAWLEDYVTRNWDSVRYSVGCYKLEEEGPRLFTRIQGDYFTVLGLPLLEVLSYLTLRGTLPA